MKISPSILAADLTNIQLETSKLIDAQADLIHFDVMDGHYVPNLTFGVPLIKAVRKICSLPFDIHLMVTNPEAYIDELATIEKIEYLSWHPQTVYHNHRLIQKIKKAGIKPGWAVNPAESADIINPVVNDLSFVLLMSVNPGFAGQSFIPSVYEKIDKIQKLAATRSDDIEVEVDGGVNDRNAPLLKKRGADILVSGSYIFKNEDYARAIERIRC